MPRILFAYPEVSPLYVNGGIGTYVYEAAHLLATAGGWEVDILTDLTFVPPGMRPDFAKTRELFALAGIRLFDLVDDGAEATRWSMPDLVRADRYHRTVAKLHAERHYNVIEFPDWRGAGFLTVRHKRTLGAFADTRLVVHLHSSSKDIADWTGEPFVTREQLLCHDMEAYVNAYADVVLSPTDFLLRALRGQEKGDRSRPLVRCGHPIGAAGPPPPALKVHLPVKDTLTVACVSRLERRKGQDILARAIRRAIEAAALDRQVEFVFCGNDAGGAAGDGSMTHSLRRILNGVPNWSIRGAMPRDSLLDWLREDVDICVVPSRGDNYPNVALEAARAGCALVCTDAGGIPELLHDYDLRAEVAPAGDVGALADSLVRAVRSVRREPDMRRRLAREFEAARRRQCRLTVEAYRAMAETPIREAALPVLKAAEEPKVSVIISIGRGGDEARLAVQSVFASAYSNYEVILVWEWERGIESNAWLLELRRRFPSLRVVEKDALEMRDARNCGIEAATGEFIVVLDANHLLSRDMLRRCAQVLAARPDLAYVMTYLDDEPGTRKWRKGRRASTDGQPFGTSAMLLLENTVGQGVAMVRRRAIEKVGGYANNLAPFQEWDLWLRFHEAGLEGDVIPEVHGAFVRSAPRGISSPGDRRTLRSHHALLRCHEDLVRRQALTISMVLLEECTRARGGRFVAWLWRTVATLGRAVPLVAGHPVWAIRYAFRRIIKRAAAKDSGRRNGLVSPAAT